MHSADPSIIAGVRLQCSSGGQMHSPAVALSKIDLCESRDTSGGIKKSHLSQVEKSRKLVSRHSQLAIQRGGRQRPRAIKVSSRKYSCAFNDPTSLHSTWIMNMMSQTQIVLETKGNWDRGWSHQRMIMGILVFFPKVSEGGECDVDDGLDLGISTATLAFFCAFFHGVTHANLAQSDKPPPSCSSVLIK